jgi:hypothetical protein
VPGDPDGTSALRGTPPMVDSPPTRGAPAPAAGVTGQTAGVASPAAIDEFFRNAPELPIERVPRRERRTVNRRDTGGERRLEARKVHRTVRHIEPWSVLKISLIFYFCLWIIMLVAGAILWRVASSSGIIDNVESFIEEIFALEKDSFAFEGGQMFRAYAVGGLVMVVAATGFTVLLAVLFNLISDLTGGVRVTVVEEETARPRAD